MGGDEWRGADHVLVRVREQGNSAGVLVQPTLNFSVFET